MAQEKITKEEFLQKYGNQSQDENDNGMPLEMSEVSRKAADSKCPNCGNELKFLAGTRKNICEACDSTFKIESIGSGKLDSEEMDYVSTSKKLKTEGNDNEVRTIRCSDCGGFIKLSKTQLSLKCPYCDSNRVIEESKKEKEVPIKGVIPFIISEQEVQEHFVKWIISRKMAPLAFKKGVRKPSYSAFYIPFYTFDSDTFTKYSGDRGTYYYVTVGSGKNKHRERRTKWTHVSGSFGRFFDDVLVPGTHNSLNEYVLKCADYDLNGMEKYQEKFLLGYYSEMPSVTLDEGYANGKATMTESIKQECIRRVRDDTYRDLQFNTNFSNVTFKKIMAPIYNGTYEYNKKKYHFVLNGQTGTASGKTPISVLKVSLIVLAFIAIIVAIFLLAYYGE